MKLFREYIYFGEKNNGTSKLGELVDYKFSEIKTSRPIEFIKKYRHAHVYAYVCTFHSNGSKTSTALRIHSNIFICND